MDTEIGENMAINEKNTKINNLDDFINIGDYQIDLNPKEKKDIKVVFMGTPTFAIPILEKLIQNYKVILVVCQPDKEKDRKKRTVIPPVKELAIQHQIEVFQPAKIKEDYQRIIEANPDIIITCAYGQIIPSKLLTFPKYGCINVHGSLLPKYRGGAPIHWALINGEKETGITIMDMNEKMDAGDIISQAKIKITDETTLDNLYQEMANLGADLLERTLPSIIDKTAKRTPQDESQVTFGWNITKEDEKIDFSKTVEEVFNLVRGLNSNPGAHTNLAQKRMKIYKVEKIKQQIKNPKYGEITKIEKDGFYVTCKDGSIKILELGLEGKKRCSAKDYLNGIEKSKLIGSVLYRE